jgi:hypothetical protein
VTLIHVPTLPFSIPNISFINVDPMSLADCSELILERHAPVMFLLVGNVTFDVFDVGLAHGKDPIARLPLEMMERWSLPFESFR